MVNSTFYPVFVLEINPSSILSILFKNEHFILLSNPSIELHPTIPLGNIGTY